MKQTAMQEIIDFIESQEYNFLNKEQLESCNKIKEKAEQLLEKEEQQIKEQPINPNNQEVIFHQEHQEYFYEDIINGKKVTVWLGKDYVPKEEPCDNCNNDVCCCIIRVQPKQERSYSEEEVTILLVNIINEIEIRKQNIISKSETMSLHLLEGGCMAFESSQDVVKEQVKQFKNK